MREVTPPDGMTKAARGGRGCPWPSLIQDGTHALKRLSEVPQDDELGQEWERCREPRSDDIPECSGGKEVS